MKLTQSSRNNHNGLTNRRNTAQRLLFQPSRWAHRSRSDSRMMGSVVSSASWNQAASTALEAGSCSPGDSSVVRSLSITGNTMENSGIATFLSKEMSLRSEAPTPALVVFSGGTAFNSVAGHMRALTRRVGYVLPVSDDGGSTAEIVRVLGGPAVGDIRSRCLRLADDSDEEARAVKRLLAHRLCPSSTESARMEWYSIVEGEGPLWQGVSEPYKHVIRAFLLHFHTQILSHNTQRFDYRNGSVGNFFFAGARTFFRSLEAAIFLFSRVARIPEGSLVLPAICTEQHITLGAELEDGTIIAGQNNISHPPSSTDGSAMQVDKEHNHPPLPSPIRRIFYLSQEGDCSEHEVSPPANARVVHEIERADAIIYGMGSLYTSICPSLCLNGIGEAIAARDNIPKVLLLNGSHDRETSSSGTHDGPMSATDIVHAVTDALNRRLNRRGERLCHKPSSYVTALLVPYDGEVDVDENELRFLGVHSIKEVQSIRSKNGECLFEPDALVQAISEVLLPDGGLHP